MTAPIIVVMGVSGCGKSVVGACLADRLGCAFVDGDDLHPPANIARMRAGIALTDADRAGWLDAVADRIAGWRAAGTGGVVACSALRRRYRDRLRAGAPGLRFVHLVVDRAELRQRLATRRHFMPPSLLDSQLATLEPPGADEPVVAVAPAGSIAATCAAAWRALDRAGDATPD